MYWTWCFTIISYWFVCWTQSAKYLMWYLDYFYVLVSSTTCLVFYLIHKISKRRYFLFKYSFHRDSRSTLRHWLTSFYRLIGAERAKRFSVLFCSYRKLLFVKVESRKFWETNFLKGLMQPNNWSGASEAPLAVTCAIFCDFKMQSFRKLLQQCQFFLWI